MSKFGLILLAPLAVCLFSCAGAPPVEDDPVVGDPLKGVVLGDQVVGCALMEDGVVVEVYSHYLGREQLLPARACSLARGSPHRWHLSHGAFWVSRSWSPEQIPTYLLEVQGGGLERIDMPVFSQMGEDLFNRLDAHFTYGNPAGRLADTVHSDDKFLYMDYLPAGKCRVRQFLATNLPGSEADRSRDLEEVKKAPRVFSSYLGEGEWDAKEGVWKPKPWKLEWSAPPAFVEPFQALSLGDDFYFATRSGALFRAAKPATGTDRVLTPVWGSKKQRIKAFITDSATGKTFLFVPPARVGGKPAFFELSDKPKLVEYDPKLVPLPPVAEPHRTILHATRILVALKKIKPEPLPEPGFEKKKP